jgi:hypothetical protein
MNKPRSTFATLRERAEQYVLEHLPAPLQLRRVQLISMADELDRAALVSKQFATELDAWRAWATRLVLSERWARCAAEHDRGSHWRVLLSAYAVIALLVDDLDQLEAELSERAKAAEQFDLDPATGEKVTTPAQQVGIVFQAMLEELFAAKSHTTRHYYDPVSPPNGNALQALQQTWDRQKLAIGRRDLVTSATHQAITIATERLGPAPTQSQSH